MLSARGLLLLGATQALALKANSWQARLDKATLNVDLDVRSRLRLLKKVAQDPKVRDDVASAIQVVQEKGFGKGQCVHGIPTSRPLPRALRCVTCLASADG